MSSLNQTINSKLGEIRDLLAMANQRKQIGRSNGRNPIDKKLHASVVAEHQRRTSLLKNDKRNKVKAGHGIRPTILAVLMKSRKELKRSELADLVAKRAPRGVAWSLGSCNIALGGLVKARMIRKEVGHGGKFSITKTGREYARQLRRSA